MSAPNPEIRRRVSSLLLGVLLLAGFARTAAAQGFGTPVAGYSHSVGTTRHGLPQNIVRGLLQTRDGYLWLATGTGLVRPQVRPGELPLTVVLNWATGIRQR